MNSNGFQSLNQIRNKIIICQICQIGLEFLFKTTQSFFNSENFRVKNPVCSSGFLLQFQIIDQILGKGTSVKKYSFSSSCTTSSRVEANSGSKTWPETHMALVRLLIIQVGRNSKFNKRYFPAMESISCHLVWQCRSEQRMKVTFFKKGILKKSSYIFPLSKSDREWTVMLISSKKWSTTSEQCKSCWIP